MIEMSAAVERDDDATAPTRRLIPGAYEPNTRVHRQPGSIGGGPFGAGDVPTGTSTMSLATIADRRREGGGAMARQRAERRLERR